MKNQFFDNYGGWKVWGVSKGGKVEYQVRQGNSIVARHEYLFNAMKDAKARMDAWWDNEARALREMMKEERKNAK
jgi:hypothetical protein